MAEIKEEVLTALSKFWAYILWITLGLVGKFSFDIISGKKVTLLQALASTGLAIVVGLISAKICELNDWEKHKSIVICVSSLLSEKIILALFSINYKSIAHDIAAWFTRRLRD